MIPLDEGNPPWKALLEEAITSLLHHERVKASISDDHVADTPKRVVKAFEEYFSGLMEDPVEVLRKGFRGSGYDEMITLVDIPFVSFCSHHLVPFFGKVHFGYLPHSRGRIIGLSKIPRLIEILSRRPQVQEKLTQEIVKNFAAAFRDPEYHPEGCGCVVDAVHTCMVIRGVKKSGVVTRTTALKGSFKDRPEVKQEFLGTVPRVENFRWL